MKKVTLAINIPDNGGITFFGPLTSMASKSPISYDNSHQRMYICAKQDPLEVGQTLLAMLADLQLSEPISTLDVDIPDISF
jgi:hypothetical protein